MAISPPLYVAQYKKDDGTWHNFGPYDGLECSEEIEFLAVNLERFEESEHYRDLELRIVRFEAAEVAFVVPRAKSGQT